MITKTIKRTFYILDEEDVEKAIELLTGKKYSISDMDLNVIDQCPMDCECSEKISTIYYIGVGEDEEYSKDEIAETLGFEYPWLEICTPLDMIFTFDVNKFKSFKRHSAYNDQKLLREIFSLLEESPDSIE